MKRKVLFVVLALLLCATLVIAQEPIYDHFVYLPVVPYGSSEIIPSNPTPGIAILPTVTDSSPNPAPGIDRIALLADTQNNPSSLHPLTIASLAARPNDILVMAGDIVHVCGCTDVQCTDARWEEQLGILEPLEDLEWHFSPGNHDDCAAQQDPQLGIAAWEKWVGERYHTFTTTNACFFMVDDQHWDVKQEQWLDTSIDQCTKPWRILVKHFPMPYGIEPLFDKNFERYAGLDVNLIIAGHRHSAIVWRTETVLNIVVPSAVGVWLPRYGPAPTVGDEVITPFPIATVGFGELKIGPETLTWQIYRWDGLLLLEGTEFVTPA